MTDDDRSTDWPDERLASTFAARASGVRVPTDLASETVALIRSTPRKRIARTRLGLVFGIAAGLAIVTALGSASVLAPKPTNVPPPALPSVVELPMISVSEAIAVRDGGFDDREIAVSGWYASPGPVPCPAPPFDQRPNPTRPWCPMTLTWLTEQREQPKGPGSAALNPSLALVDASVLPNDADEVVSVVFIGHFDDRRAEFCPAEEDCADTFVVDRIDQVDGRDIPTSSVREVEVIVNGTTAALDPVQTEMSIDSAVKRVDPGLQVLSRRLLTPDRLALSEPSYATTSPRLGALVPELVWLVVALPQLNSAGRAVARTFLVPDVAIGSIVEITREGEVLARPTATPNPSPRPTAAPPTTVVGQPISVAEAIERRDGHLDDTEIAVHASWVDHSASLRCGPRLVRASPLEGCRWIRLFDESPTDPDGLDDPNGPELQPVLDAAAFVAPGLALPANDATEVIAIGHFDDHRAGSCMANGCRFLFVVDALLDPSNPELDVEAIEAFRPDRSATAVASTTEVLRFASSPPLGSGLVFAAFPVAGENLAQYEPQADESSALVDAAAVWVVRFIDPAEEGPPVLKTELVIDGRITSLAGSTFVPTRQGLMIETTIID
jgi:hypothetical protein